jgi:ubiquinone/menaquinone biosynthesis C-methylase UbiE
MMKVLKIVRIIKKPYVAVALKFLALYGWLNRNNCLKIWKRKKGDLIKVYLNDVNRKDRDLLIDKVVGFEPKSVLEVGCFVGANLYLLNERLPDIELRGIDPNELAVFEGNKWLWTNCRLRSQSWNVQLSLGSTRDMTSFLDNSFDVVFTRAVLLHIGDKHIDEALRHMLRIAKKGVVLLEWQDLTGRLKGKEQGWLDGHWVRRYDLMIKRLVPSAEVRITPLLRDVWKEWNDHGGAYIEVIKEVKR